MIDIALQAVRSHADSVAIRQRRLRCSTAAAINETRKIQ